ncbi:MAG: hypothetical protein NTZ19_15560 [Bacteroidetes bacterium]|nr:hypothetical protein [Bacteroidota bacterium]
MRKHIIGIVLSTLSLFAVNMVFAQQIDSMMGVYADRAAPEKIHIHFDKSIYNKAETVWYKIYILQGSDTAATSKNVYLDWYDASGKLIKQTVSPILLSTAQGSFDVPADYEGGLLQVKAYTRWMLNDDPAFSYLREIFINTNNTSKPVSNKTTVEIFPEGGFLIQGLNSRVAFKATNQYGNPVFIKGVLTDEKNKLIDSLQVLHDGMGSFFLQPLTGQSYQLNWTDENGNTGTTPIPVNKTEGAEISISTANSIAKIQVERTNAVSDNFKQLTLLIHMNRVALYQVALNTTNKTKLNAEIPLLELPTGLLQFTLFTSDWIPVAERVLFVNNHAHEFEVTLKTALTNLEKRGKNAIDITVPDTLFTNMSLSITDAAVNAPDQHSIFSDIFLSSEIKGKVYNPAYYLMSDADSVKAHLDLVMLTNGWRKFDWDKIKAQVPPTITYPVETNYMKLEGKVLGAALNSSSEVLNMFITAKDSSKQLIIVPVAIDGSFSNPIFFYDTAKLFYSFNNNVALANSTHLQLNNGLFKLEPANIAANYSAPFLWNDLIAQQKLNALLVEQEKLKKNMAEATLKEVTVTSRVKSKEQVLSEKYSTSFFSHNEAGIFDLTDNSKPVYSRNILEYLQSRVAGLDIIQDNVSWRGDIPEFFLNEMRVDKATAINIDMNSIAMIKVFRPPFMFATGGGRGGAIAIYTKKGDDNKINLNIKGLDYTLLEGYTKFKEFYSPNYEKPEDSFTKHDTRTTLYWNPYLFTNKTKQTMHVEFFNSDITRAYTIVLEGINAAGKITRLERVVQ